MTDLNDEVREVGSAANEEVETETVSAEEQSAATPKRRIGKGKMALLTVAVIFVMLAAGGGTVYATQHDNPDFCNFVCHTPMDPYVNSYKEGISVNKTQASSNILLSVSMHKAAGEASGNPIKCLTCHEASISEQVNEGIHWVTGNYTDPLEPLMVVKGQPAEGQKSGAEFCLRPECHEGITSTQELAKATNSGSRNPHDAGSMHPGKYEDCSGCHQVHEQSTYACAYCHQDVKLPDGWAKPDVMPKF